MIKNAQEAREILACSYDDEDEQDRLHENARCYLAALSGPEVTALVDTFEFLSRSTDTPHGRIAKDALAQYRDAAKGE